MMNWYAENSIYRQSVELFATKVVDGKRFCLTTVFTQKEIEPSVMAEGPTLELSGDEAQQIMNELWRIGIRPKDGSGAIAHTEAIQGHLADMRKLAFHALKVPE